jgi:branched-chain amino acid transport system substrate-binding protein
MSFLSSLGIRLAAAVIGIAACSGWAIAQATPQGEPVVIGVSGPLTGQYAQYGAQWKRGFDVALDEINGSGGINGRPLQYVFEDSQSDPRQSVAIARKFVSDPRIVAEIGDFSSAASMAASPIYNAGKLVQFGFTNSHPDFTKGGEYMWSNAPNQSDEMPTIADMAIEGLGLKKLAALYLNNDWGRTSKDLLVKAAEQRGATVVGTEGYLADEKDFRSAIVRLREQNPDGIIMISYYPDGAQITRQLRAAGLTQPIVAMGSVYSPKFVELGGEAVNGVYTNVPFFPGDPRPIVQKFDKAFEAKFGTEPDAYNGRAYDAMTVLGSVLRQYGTTREAVREGLSKIKGVPSVVYGEVQFNQQTRRVEQPIVNRIIVKDGKFVAWNGQRSPSQ